VYRIGVHTLFYLLILNLEAMLTPSLKDIMLFSFLNICIIILFNVMLFGYSDFLTYERNNSTLMMDQHKIGKLVSVFILTIFTLNILLFRFLLRIGNQPIYSSIKASIGVIFVGILTLVIGLLYNLN